MEDFEETFAKKITRNIIYDNAITLREDGLFNYIGLPGRKCTDIKEWKENIQNALCCEFEENRFDEMQKTLHRIMPGKFKSVNGNIWELMRTDLDEFYDLCNLDFCGGPSSTEIPEISEFRSLSEFFSNQRTKRKNKPFLISWTLGVRNPNFEFYRDKVQDYMCEIYPKNQIDMDEFRNWISESGKKMLRSYVYFIPCTTFEQAKNSRYRVEIIDSFVYKKIMYFGLFKLIPKDEIVSVDDKINFFQETFDRSYPVYDKNNKYLRGIKFPINDFLD